MGGRWSVYGVGVGHRLHEVSEYGLILVLVGFSRLFGIDLPWYALLVLRMRLVFVVLGWEMWPVLGDLLWGRLCEQ